MDLNTLSKIMFVMWCAVMVLSLFVPQAKQWFQRSGALLGATTPGIPLVVGLTKGERFDSVKVVGTFVVIIAASYLIPMLGEKRRQ